jgi:hypothetical protein
MVTRPKRMANDLSQSIFTRPDQPMIDAWMVRSEIRDCCKTPVFPQIPLHPIQATTMS